MLLTEGQWYASQVLYGDFHFVTSSLSHQPNLITINESPFTLRQNQVFLLKRCSVHSIQIHDLDLKLTGCPLRMDEWLWRLHLSVVYNPLLQFPAVPSEETIKKRRYCKTDVPDSLPRAKWGFIKEELCPCGVKYMKVIERNQPTEKMGSSYSKGGVQPLGSYCWEKANGTLLPICSVRIWWVAPMCLNFEIFR